MLTEQGCTVIACPGPGEEAACASALPGVTPIPGLGLGAYAAIMATAQRVVANDSGPMHLAAAVGAPVLGVFGVSDPQRTRPWSDRIQVIGSERGFPSVQAVWAAVETLDGLKSPGR
jgi:heptosyltransferase-2